MAFEDSVLCLLIWLWSRQNSQGTGKIKAYGGNWEASLHIVAAAKADNAVYDAWSGMSAAPSYLGGKSVVGSANSIAFFADIIPCWDDALFKQNFRVSRVTFMYLHSQL